MIISLIVNITKLLFKNVIIFKIAFKNSDLRSKIQKADRESRSKTSLQKISRESPEKSGFVNLDRKNLKKSPDYLDREIFPDFSRTGL